MALSQFSRWFRRHNGQSTPSIPGLHSASEFQTVLNRERARAERTATSVSLVVFKPAQQTEFAGQLVDRIRVTDCAGLLSNDRAGVILWNAGEAGARRFVDSLIARIGCPSAPHFEIFVYEGTGTPDQSSFVRPPRNERIADEQDSDLEPTAQPLEALFVKPLPIWKRTIDIVASSVALIGLSPVLLVAAAAIKMTSKGPVLFMQQRAGLGGRAFKIYKFRTMVIDAEAKKAALRAVSEQDGPAFKMARDPRVTTIGRYLRMSCIDELPQLLNVLRGEMTLVGPRPLPLEESNGCRGWQRRRLEITPGLTCIWQVNGKSRVPFVEWMRMDIRYIGSRTFIHDVSLIAKTVLTVILHRGSC